MISHPVILITGANTGLGFETAKALAKEGSWNILIGSRSIEKGEAAVAAIKSALPFTSSTLSVIELDVTSDSSISAAFEHISFKYGRLDFLVNNAGGGFDVEAQKGQITLRQSLNYAHDLNVTGAHIVTHTMVPLLLKSAKPRIIFVTSGTSPLSIPEASYLQGVNRIPEKGWPKGKLMNPVLGYRCSKTGLNMLMTDWDRVLRNDGVVVVLAVSPGFLATGLGIGKENAEMLKRMGAQDPEVGARVMMDAILGRRDADHGKAVNLSGIQAW